MKRLFLAIKILPDQNFIKHYNFAQTILKHEKINWVLPDLMHLTIKFFGDTYDDEIKIVNNVIVDTLRGKSSFNIDVESAGVFGSRYKPRALWFGISNAEFFVLLSNQLLNNLDNAGFKCDRQNFVPHLTIGRIKNIQNKNNLNLVVNNMKNIHLQNVKVDRLYLYNSTLTSKGPIYEVVETYKLQP